MDAEASEGDGHSGSSELRDDDDYEHGTSDGERSVTVDDDADDANHIDAAGPDSNPVHAPRPVPETERSEEEEAYAPLTETLDWFVEGNDPLHVAARLFPNDDLFTEGRTGIVVWRSERDGHGVREGDSDEQQKGQRRFFQGSECTFAAVTLDAGRVLKVRTHKDKRMRVLVMGGSSGNHFVAVDLHYVAFKRRYPVCIEHDGVWLEMDIGPSEVWTMGEAMYVVNTCSSSVDVRLQWYREVV